MFFKKKYRRLLFLILAIFIIGLLLLTLNLICSNCLEGSWAKIFISLFTVFIAVLELGDIFPNKRHKKIAIYISVIALFLVSIWDTGKENIEYTKEANKRDSLITVDSLRSAKIIEGLNKNIIQLEEISGSVITSLQEVSSVKESVGEQKPILIDILTNTTESSKQTELLMGDNQPNLVIYSERFRAYFDNEGYLNIKAILGNVGNGIAYDIQIFYQVLYIEKSKFAPNTDGVSLVFEKDSNKLYPKQWTKLSESTLPAHIVDHKNETSLKPSLTRKDFKDNNSSWALIYSISYLDFTKSKRISKTLTVLGTINENNQFDLRYNVVNLEPLKEYFENNFGMGEYIFTK